MTRVKICGMTNETDAAKAVRLGAWALGFIFYKKSPRFISPFKARKIIQALPPFVVPVGVFVDHPVGAVQDILHHCGLRVAQLHGGQDHHFCHRLKTQGFKVIKVFRVGENFDSKILEPFKVDAFLFDTLDPNNFGGSGKAFDWGLLGSIKSSISAPIILSGGLNTQNVIEAINALKPYAVDVASGVEEAPGKKDHKKMKDFIDIVGYISGPKVKEISC